MATLSFSYLLALPEEMIDTICQNFCPCCSQSPSPRYFISSEWSNPAYDRKCLLALSLTCQELRRISQPHLYHRLGGYDFMGFVNNMHQTPALGQIKELYMNEDAMMSLYLEYENQYKFGTPPCFGSWILFTSCYENLMFVVINFTPMLHKLEIYVRSDRQLLTNQSKYFPNLKELTITFRDGFMIEHHPESLADLLHAAPRLERIELCNFKKLRADFRHDTVNELTLRSCMIPISRMTGLMLDDFPKLQTLRFSAPKYPQRFSKTSQQTGLTYKIEDLLMLRSDTLKHLILDYPGIELDHPGEIVIQDLSMMKALETLYIDSGMLHRRWEQDRLRTQRLCHLLPRSIKEFGLMGSAYPLVHGEVVQSINISAEAFPHLKKVFVAQFDKEWRDDGDDWERTYASACEAANIELSSWLPPSVQQFMFQSGP